MIAALLSTGVPLALLWWAGDGGFGDLLMFAGNLVLMAVPHWLLWWLAAKRGAGKSAECYGGLVGANVMLAFYTSNDMALLWFFYWPLAAAAGLVGQAVTERLVERWRVSR